MSRANKKMCEVIDLQHKNPTVVLTKKDLDLIIEGLWLVYAKHDNNTKTQKRITDMTGYFRNITKVLVCNQTSGYTKT